MENKILTAEIKELIEKRANPLLSNIDRIRITSAIYRRKTVLRYLEGGDV